tara:strand:- start:297 stop:1190 length:894 start_codon:yes stop_codon:yes gene_type:complete
LINTKKITLLETGLRDGLQAVKNYVSIKERILIANGLIDAGIRNIQITSFVNPKKVPQMSESEELIQSLNFGKNVEYSALIFNLRGVERAINSGIGKIETSISVSENYNRKNLGLNNKQAINRLKEVTQFAISNKLKVRAGLQCVWGTSLDRNIQLNKILKNISFILEQGVDKISLCDTSGFATPDTIARLLELVYNKFPKVKICLHLHNTYGNGLKNLRRALQFGIKEIDTSLGGVGGTPYLKNSKGNIATEDTVLLLKDMGYETGIDYKLVSEQSKFLEKIIGSEYFSSRVYKTN